MLQLFAPISKCVSMCGGLQPGYVVVILTTKWRASVSYASAVSSHKVERQAYVTVRAIMHSEEWFLCCDASIAQFHKVIR